MIHTLEKSHEVSLAKNELTFSLCCYAYTLSSLTQYTSGPVPQLAETHFRFLWVSFRGSAGFVSKVWLPLTDVSQTLSDSNEHMITLDLNQNPGWLSVALTLLWKPGESFEFGKNRHYLKVHFPRQPDLLLFTLDLPFHSAWYGNPGESQGNSGYDPAEGLGPQIPRVSPVKRPQQTLQSRQEAHEWLHWNSKRLQELWKEVPEDAFPGTHTTSLKLGVTDSAITEWCKA